MAGATEIDAQRVTWQKFINTLKQCLWRREISESEEFRQGLPVQSRPEAVHLQQCFDLGREGEPILCNCIIKRLDTEAVACAKEFFPLLIPDGECKHTLQIL